MYPSPHPRITSASAGLEWELMPVAASRDCGTEGDRKHLEHLRG